MRSSPFAKAFDDSKRLADFRSTGTVPQPHWLVFSGLRADNLAGVDAVFVVDFSVEVLELEFELPPTAAELAIHSDVQARPNYIEDAYGAPSL